MYDRGKTTERKERESKRRKIHIGRHPPTLAMTNYLFSAVLLCVATLCCAQVPNSYTASAIISVDKLYTLSVNSGPSMYLDPPFTPFATLTHSLFIPPRFNSSSSCVLTSYTAPFITPYTTTDIFNKWLLISNTTAAAGKYFVLKNMGTNLVCSFLVSSSPFLPRPPPTHFCQQNLQHNTGGTTLVITTPAQTSYQKWYYSMYSGIETGSYLIRNEGSNCYLSKSSDTSISCEASVSSPPLPTQLWRFIDQNPLNDVYY